MRWLKEEAELAGSALSALFPRKDIEVWNPIDAQERKFSLRSLIRSECQFEIVGEGLKAGDFDEKFAGEAFFEPDDFGLLRPWPEYEGARRRRGEHARVLPIRIDHGCNTAIHYQGDRTDRNGFKIDAIEDPAHHRWKIECGTLRESTGSSTRARYMMAPMMKGLKLASR